MADCVRTSDVEDARGLLLLHAAGTHFAVDAKRTAVVGRLFGVLGLTLGAPIHALLELGFRHLVGRRVVGRASRVRRRLASSPIRCGERGGRLVGRLLTARALAIGAARQPQRREPEEQTPAWASPLIYSEAHVHERYSRTTASRTRVRSFVSSALPHSRAREEDVPAVCFGVRIRGRWFAFAT